MVIEIRVGVAMELQNTMQRATLRKTISGVNRILRPFGFRFERVGDKRNECVVHVSAERPSRGNVLLSYIVDPFLVSKPEEISHDHTHHWESWQIAQSFLKHGFSVDVVHFHNTSFVPKKEYRFFVGARTNFERISKLLNPDCVKIVHLDTCHWLFNNQAAFRRLLNVQQHRGVTIGNPKTVEANWAIECADIACVLGNAFTAETYRYAGKPIHYIPISAPTSYPWDDCKNFEAARNSFIWFGSAGFVHKGLDIVLEAFAKLPDLNLTVCGPLETEPDFVEAYRKELFETPNIEAVGWVDVSSPEFTKIAGRCGALVYPTCAEGGGGSVITCMHLGVVPLVTTASSVNLEGFGRTIEATTVELVTAAVKEFAATPVEAIEREARSTWEYVRAHHTRESFAQCYDEFVRGLLPDGNDSREPVS